MPDEPVEADHGPFQEVGKGPTSQSTCTSCKHLKNKLKILKHRIYRLKQTAKQGFKKKADVSQKNKKKACVEAYI